ncbi:MAG: HAD family hydrolase [Oscillospiraceae bacterium]|nr:HAD family hydrolase [Oscillospiraceae bacterium]
MRMIATDLDGTLLRRDKTLSDYTAQVLRQCQAQGIKVVVATGRGIRGANEVIDPADFDALSVCNGALVYIDGKLVHECNLPLEDSRAILREIEGHPAVLAMREYPASDELHTTRIWFETQDHDYAADFMRRYPHLHIKLFSDVSVYDITNTTKADAIELLAAHWGIAMADVVAFGDDFNDIDMLRACGIGVAVANAIDEAKTAADHICASNEEDGVARWIVENVL